MEPILRIQAGLSGGWLREPEGPASHPQDFPQRNTPECEKEDRRPVDRASVLGTDESL